MLHQAELIRRYQVADRASPWVRANFITSLDGAATVDGVSGGLGNEDDKRVFDTLRMLSDVIVVGAGTVRAEGYGGIRLSPADAAWRIDHGLPAQVPVAVVSSRLELPPAHPFFRDAAVRPIVITHGQSPAGRRAELAEVADVLVCGEREVDPTAMVKALVARGLGQILCEGGPHLLGTLIAADQVDELCLTISPVLEGGAADRISDGGSAIIREMAILHVLTAGDMIFLRYGRRPSA